LKGDADLQIPERELEPRAEFGQLLERPEPPLGLIVDPAVGRDEQVGVRLLALPAHPSTELIELGQAEPVGAVDDDRVRRRDVEARLHDRGRDQDVRLPRDELDHRGFQLALAHLAMGHDHAGVGDEFLDEPRHRRERLDTIVDEEDLAASLELPLERLLDDGPAEAAHHGLDGEPVERRRLDHRHVAHAGERHVERARDRRGGQRQHVDRGAKLLHLLFVGDAEAVLLVYDDEAEILEVDVAGQQPVGPDHDVDGAPGQTLDDRLLLAR